MLELKEAAEHRAQKNAIQLKELKLQEKRHAVKVKKMEINAEIQKAQLNMLTNMANMFASGPKGAVSGAGSGLSMRLGGSTTTESWVHSQQAGSSSSQNGAFSDSGMAYSPNVEFNFSTSDLHFPGS